MKTKHTTGKWIYNEYKHCIESDTEWSIEPNPEWDLDGSKTEIISTYGAMGGNDTRADIRLICSAPDMLNVLQEIIECYEQKGQLLSFDVSKVRKVLEKALT
jgi:hypothetical protein